MKKLLPILIAFIFTLSSAQAIEEVSNPIEEVVLEVPSEVEEVNNPSDDVEHEKTLREKFNTEKSTILQDTKNQIQACWNKEKKTFEKADSVKQEVFDAIKNSTKGLKGKMIAKYAAISGLAAGAVAFVAHKLFANKNNV